MLVLTLCTHSKAWGQGSTMHRL